MIEETKRMIISKWYNYCKRHGYIYQHPSDVDFDEQKDEATLSNINGTFAKVINYSGRAKFITDVKEF